jgi:hypothetical protein
MDLIYKTYSMIDEDKIQHIYIKQCDKKYESLLAPIMYMEYKEPYTDPRDPNYYSRTVLHIDITIKKLEEEQIHYRYFRALPDGKYKPLSFNNVLNLYSKYVNIKLISLTGYSPIFIFKDKSRAHTTFLGLLQLIIAKWDDWN